MTAPRPIYDYDPKHRPAYAILRVDLHGRKDSPFTRRLTVKKVVLTEAHAQAEVERLNAVNAAKGVQYIVQLTELDETGPAAEP